MVNRIRDAFELLRRTPAGKQALEEHEREISTERGVHVRRSKRPRPSSMTHCRTSTTPSPRPPRSGSVPARRQTRPRQPIGPLARLSTTRCIAPGTPVTRISSRWRRVQTHGSQA